MPDSLSITVFPDGPIKVSNAQSVKYCGERIQMEGDIFLCRCGESSNAPFCDGSHKAVGFKGSAEREPRNTIKTWEGNTVRTFFNQSACMHVFACKPLKELRDAELAGDASAADEIMRVVGLCPSGALSYETKEDIEAPTLPQLDADIEIMEGGEVRVQRAFEINAERLERANAERATLCRCGLSKNKPWCDGRHTARKDFR